MSCETTFTFFVKRESLNVADETLVFLINVHKVFLFSQLRKSVNYNTEQNVVDNNLDH